MKFHVASGRLKPGAQLPSIRSLAADLQVNTRTVVKAYEVLQRDGLVVMRQGQGVFVLQNRGGIPAHARRKALADRSRRLLADASAMGASLDEVIEALQKASKEMGMTGDKNDE